MQHKTFENRPIEIAYYMYDNKFHIFEKFNTLNDLLTHIAIITKYHFWPKYYKYKYESLYPLLENQNLAGNDKTVEANYNYIANTYILNIEEKRYTFYVQYLDQKLHTIDILNYVKEIKEIYDDPDLYLKSTTHSNNWCKYYNKVPYQIKSKHRKHNKYLLDKNDEYYEYFKSVSPRKKGADKNDIWGIYCTSSEKNWKKQTKNKRQYGNCIRNKELEQKIAFDFLKNTSYKNVS